KRIFWLEWAHRLWGRLIGAAFLIPLIWFAVTGRLDRRLIPRLVLLFCLIALQGAVGWFIVASGFFDGAAAVAPVRLVVHLALALFIYGAALWTGLSLFPARARTVVAGTGMTAAAWTIVVLVSLTVIAGGFMAGLRAGLTYNTFPFMDGHLIPAGY